MYEPIYSEKCQKYIETCTLLQGDGNLPAGCHTYEFAIPLPMDCPSSYEGKYGCVYYEISLKLNRYFQSNNVFKWRVKIISTIDLNLNIRYKVR